jgi:uncharacterized membrane protein YdjX (TVP38/TMEM64 family)
MTTMHQTLQIPDPILSERLWKDLFRIIAVSLFFAGVAILIRSESVHAHIMHIPILVKSLAGRGLPERNGPRAVLFTVAFSLLIGVGMPRLWVSALAGALFGVLWGTLLALMATLVGAAIVYWVGQAALAGMVRRRMGPRRTIWQARFEANAFWWVLYVRLFPLSNATLAGLLCGACRIPLPAYLAGSLIGFIPLTVVFAVFGSGGARGNLYLVGLGFILIAITVFGRKTVMRAFPSREPSIERRETIV